MTSASASATVTIEWVTVGNPGNAADPLTGYGAVGYEYQIGKYEVTNAQYGAFLNAVAKTDSYGLYNTSMSSYGITRSGSSGSYSYNVTTALANRPVVYVSWFDAARFANWLANGQGIADTETGAYTLNSATSGIFTKNAGAQVYIPTEDEWYKASFFSGATSTYFYYAIGQNTITDSDANYGAAGSILNVGSYSGNPSAYGTFDQAGNVAEWNDAIIITGGPNNNRGVRGGAWSDNSQSWLRASQRDNHAPDYEYFDAGFRLASAAIPEPSTWVLTILFSAGLFFRRKR